MRESVRSAFVGFSAAYEGVVPHLYLDVKSLVTTAIGNLVDPIGMALGLPFVRPDGVLATPDEIRAEWELVKARGATTTVQDPDWTDDAGNVHQGEIRTVFLHGPPNPSSGGMAFRKVTALRLTPAGIEQVVTRKLDEMDRHLRKRFVHYDTWPADAQLATLSMSWACGPAFRFPRLEAALMAGDFKTASEECRIDETGNPGVKPRNLANRTLYENADWVVVGDLDVDTLYWPANARDAFGAAVENAPHIPDDNPTSPGLGDEPAHGALPLEAMEEDSKNREPPE